MKWNKYTFATKTDAVDILSATLAEVGVEGIEVEDNVPLTEEETKGMFIDILPELGEDDGSAKISFYVDSDQDDHELLEKVQQAIEELREFMDIGEAVLEKSETEDKDWINNWKMYFKPFTVGDILIKPTWEEIPEDMPYKTMIQIDPGTAFGTGSHETTQLCIRQLEKYIRRLQKEQMSSGKERKPIQVLDVGTGSGILGIAALKLGAHFVYGTDLDEQAIEAVHMNRQSNGISEQEFALIQGNIIDNPEVQRQAGYEKYDIAVANILAPVIVLLQAEIAKHLKKGGIFITSGIIDDKEEMVKEAFEQNTDFEILETNVQGEWVSITVRKL